METETYEHQGVPVELILDMEGGDYANPRDHTNVGTFVHWHRRYVLGDEQISGQMDEAMQRGGLRLLRRYLTLMRGATVVMPVGLIDHSGISVYVGGGAHACDPGGWDSGTVGVIFDTPESREETGVPLDKVEEALKSEIEVYDLYVRGEVYGYRVGADRVEDSCFGFLGYECVKEAAAEAAEAIADDYAEMLRVKRACTFADLA